MENNTLISGDSDNLNGEEALRGILDSLNGRPKRQAIEGFENLGKLLPPNPSMDTRMEIELMPDRLVKQ
jgi:hypothetical protein